MTPSSMWSRLGRSRNAHGRLLEWRHAHGRRYGNKYCIYTSSSRGSVIERATSTSTRHGVASRILHGCCRRGRLRHDQQSARRQRWRDYRRLSCGEALRGHNQLAHVPSRTPPIPCWRRTAWSPTPRSPPRALSPCRPRAPTRPERAFSIVDETGNCSVTKTLTITSQWHGRNRWRGFGGRQSGLWLHWHREQRSGRMDGHRSGFHAGARINRGRAAWSQHPDRRARDTGHALRRLRPTPRSRSRPIASCLRSARASSRRSPARHPMRSALPATYRNSARLSSICGRIDQLRADRPDCLLHGDDNHHHRGGRIVHRRPGEAVDLLHARESLGRLAAFSLPIGWT